MQVSVKLQAGNDIDVPLAPIGDDLPHLVLGEPPARIDQRIAIKLDACFVIEVILIGFPARKKIKLTFDFFHGGQRAMAHVDHYAAIRERRPVVYFNFGKDSLGPSALDELAQRLTAIEQPGRGDGTELGSVEGYSQRVSLTGLAARLLAWNRQRVNRAGSPQVDHMVRSFTLRHGHRDRGAVR